MHKLVGHYLGARTEAEGGNDLGTRITGDPEPGGIGRSSQFQTQFVELHMG